MHLINLEISRNLALINVVAFAFDLPKLRLFSNINKNELFRLIKMFYIMTLILEHFYDQCHFTLKLWSIDSMLKIM